MLTESPSPTVARLRALFASDFEAMRAGRLSRIPRPVVIRVLRVRLETIRTLEAEMPRPRFP